MLGFKIILTKSYIVRVHRETVFFYKFLKRRAVKAYKAVKCGDRIGYVVFNSERFGLFKRRLACFDGVYNIFLDGGKLSISYIAVNYVYFCGADYRAFAL